MGEYSIVHLSYSRQISLTLQRVLRHRPSRDGERRGGSLAMATITTDERALALSRANGDLLVLTHVYTATLVVGLGGLFGLLQGLSRANMIVMPPWFDYYRMLTVHGVLMALVFTTFFITGLMTLATYRSMPRLRSVALGWL